MNENKTYFQRVAAMLETLLKQYKNVYPKNYGDIIRNFFPAFLMILSPFIFLYLFVGSVSMGSILVGFFVPPVLFLFGFLLRRFNEREHGDKSDLLPKIQDLKQQLTGFCEYADVENYLVQFDRELLIVTKNRNRRLKIFNIAKITTIAVCIIAVVVSINCQASDTELKNSKDLNDFYELLDMKKDEPFLTLLPLKTKISDGYEVLTSPVDFYFSGVSDNHLTIDMLEISGTGSGEEVFRVVITDKNGVPVSRCPQFIIEGYETVVGSWIKSETFCYDLTHQKQNNFEAFQVLKFLSENKQNLRFVVEKVK